MASNSRVLQKEGSEFLQNFDAKTSRREEKKKRKTSKKERQEKTDSETLYDEHGKIRATGVDYCDCLDIECPGCHFPCTSCNSPKCGIKCRVNRKWAYESIEHDGRDKRIINTIINPSSSGHRVNNIYTPKTT